MTDKIDEVWMDLGAGEIFTTDEFVGADDDTEGLVKFIREDLYEDERQRAEKAEASDAESIAMYQQARRRAEKERARAEKAEEALRELVAECTCHPAYSGRGMQDPECPAGLFGDIAREGLGLPPRCHYNRAALRQDEGGDE